MASLNGSINNWFTGKWWRINKRNIDSNEKINPWYNNDRNMRSNQNVMIQNLRDKQARMLDSKENLKF